jgi:hypothetical protein
MITLPNFLIISGEGRNVGKTILACNIISKFSRTYNIISLKITPHVHKDIGNAKTLLSDDDSVLYEESGDYTRKDSSRMMAAGARRSFLLQVSDAKLKEGLKKFLKITGKNVMVVCESARLQTIVKPGISLFLRHVSCQTGKEKKKKPPTGISRIVNFNINSFDLNLNTISIENNEWKLKEEEITL